MIDLFLILTWNVLPSIPSPRKFERPVSSLVKVLVKALTIRGYAHSE
jgi:hypothetical protein